jgi:hypothetical protein
MKFLIPILALNASLTLFAQTPSNPESSEVEKPAVPLSRATLDKIQKMTPLFDGKTLDGWEFATNAWVIKDGAMASTGAGRGVIYTKGDYRNFRLIFTMRHESGQPDHQACFLIFCTRPSEGQKGLDALGGIQFQPPNGGHWDYRPGHNNSGGSEFTKPPHPKFDPHEWNQVEILVNAQKGTARMAVAQPVWTMAVEVLDFKDETAGKAGPIAWQMHNKGLFDEYKDVRIEAEPKADKLITVEE